ncbi:MAG: hypothetical protein EXR69_15900 [Myxococcales bacterium]|nr:hypothetical protein [Myxococcales bacterium]
MRTVLLLLPSLAALGGCGKPETGNDTTVLSGTVTIPPAAVDEVDSVGTPNDASPQPLGDDGSANLTYRAVTLTGSTSSWTPDSGGVGDEDDEAYGDADLYSFSPVADGTFTITVTFPTTTDAEGADAVVYDIYIADAATLDVATGVGTGATDGSAGSYTLSADVLAGGSYVLVIGGVSNADGDIEVPYSVTLSGSEPVDNTVLVGAYLESDAAVASNPVGGSTVTAWAFDDATLSWFGTYEIMFLMSVVMPPDDDTADTAVPGPDVDNALDGPIYLMAGTLSNLNGTPSAGSLYSSVAVETSATDTATAVDTAILLDALFPKVIGIEATETLPDETLAQLDAVGYLDETTVVAQDLGMLSGLGYVDTIDGSSALTGEEGTASNDIDVYSFTVPEAMNVRMKASWPTVATDIDFGIWGNDPAYGTFDWFDWGDTYCQTGSNPEACETVVALEAGATYYVLAMGYLGPVGEEPYHIELEWVP